VTASFFDEADALFGKRNQIILANMGIPDLRPLVATGQITLEQAEDIIMNALLAFELDHIGNDNVWIECEQGNL
jgi:hypothetical protein